MEPNTEDEGSEQQPGINRGLDQVSHLFLSHVAERAARGRSLNGSELPPSSPDNRPPKVLLTSRRVNRDQLLSLLREQPAALEEGMKVIDVNLPCETFGDIELLGVDGSDRLAVIDVDDKPNDSLLLHGMAHWDWLVGNATLLRRVYQGQTINFSLEPRLVLVAPDFSPLFRRAMHYLSSLQIDCIKYHGVGLAGGTGIFCEQLFGSTPPPRR